MTHPNLIESLIPHRPPFLMVDSIENYTGGLFPELMAKKQIKSEHYQDSGWPIMYAVEGLGQCCNLLSVLSGIDNNKFKDFDEISAFLLHKNEVRKSNGLFVNMFSKFGLLASIDVEIIDGNITEDKILYKVKQTRAYNNMSLFRVSAIVGKNEKVVGTMLGAKIENNALIY